MNKIAHYLQEHLSGEVMTSNEAREYFATDGSILSLTPLIVVYPRNETTCARRHALLGNSPKGVEWCPLRLAVQARISPVRPLAKESSWPFRRT